MNNCYCGSGKPFSVCCAPIIENESAQTAEQLMRSRYSAYAIGNADYLMKTLHSSVRDQQNYSDIKQWSVENSWTKLEIVSAEFGEVSDVKGIVEFKAFYTNKAGSEQMHHERSSFVKEAGKWFYVDGVFNPSVPKISRNAPCPCGSGKKFKKCCGA